MDFSDAQFMGLAIAYGKAYLRFINHDHRLDTDLDFIAAALFIGNQFLKKYCIGCHFHFKQSVQKISVRMSTQPEEQSDFKNLAHRWQTATSVAAGEVFVRKILVKYPQLQYWVDWWKKRAHLIIEAVMKDAKSDDAMLSHPTTNNNIEAFHRVFHHVAAKTHLPLLLAVTLVYHYAIKCQTHVEGIESGHSKAKRRRGSQHKRRRLSLLLTANEFHEARPEVLPKAPRAVREQLEPRAPLAVPTSRKRKARGSG